jgi:hypothetical protein
MKRFLFPLDRVGIWRAGQAALEELKLEQLGVQMEKLSEEVRSAQTDRTESEREVLQQSTIQAMELQSLDAYRLFTRDKIRGIENRQRQLEAEAAEQRQRVIRARRDAELLERLKQKALAAWQAASEKEQEGFAAELYLGRRTRHR